MADRGGREGSGQRPARRSRPLKSVSRASPGPALFRSSRIKTVGGCVSGIEVEHGKKSFRVSGGK